VVNDTHGSFEDVLALARPADRPVCRALRELIASLDASFVEVVWPRHKIASFGVGPKKMTQHYAYIGVQRTHVNLGFYHGSSLSDPAGILEGAGKELRHVKIRGLAAVGDSAIANLLREAIAERRPYAGDD